MWFDSEHVVLTAGVGTGISEVVAFDAALRAAGIADFNLIRVTSIVPPSVPVHMMVSGSQEPIAGDGMMLPTVYSIAASNCAGTRVSAAVGVGVPSGPTQSGVIFPNSGEMGEAECRDELIQFIAEGMKALRRIDSYSVEIASASDVHGPGNKWTVAFAALCFCDAELWRYFVDVID